MAHSGSNGHFIRPKHSQPTQIQRQGQGQGQGNGARTFQNAAWNFDEFAQQASSSSSGRGSHNNPTSLRTGTQAPRLQGNAGQGLKRGLGDYSNSSQQHRGSFSMAPPSVNSFNSSNTNNIRTNNHNNTPATVPINEDQSSLGFSQAYALGVSIPTSKFNTEAFGSLSVRPVSGTTSGVGTTSTGPGTGVVTDIENQFDPDSLDDDFDIPLDIDDDFGMMEMHVDKDGHDLETTAETGRNGIGFVESHSSMTQNGDDRVEDSQAVMEAAALKQKVAELETELAKKQEQLLVESGRASVLKDKLEDVNKTHVALSQRFKEAQVQYETEKQSMEEKHEKALANANMNHQFEVQRYILDGPTAPKGVKSSQQVRATSTQPTTALFPKEFSGFASTQSSIRVVQTRNDDGFSHRNLGVAPISPRKPVMHGTNISLEKPRPFQIPSEFSKTARPVFGFNSDIPTQSEEEIIRDKLLAGHEHSYGLRQLLTIEADEEKISPLPGSQDYERNIRLEQITENCVTALSNLILDVNPHSKSEALKATTTLLRASLVMRKPLHTVNSLQVMTTLCYSFEDIANEVCRGAVPFLESEREDPLAVIPSDMSLTSALACIHFLFLNRMALPIPTTALPPFPSMRREHSLTKDAEELLEANIFLLLNLVVRQHLETKSMSRIFVPLIRLRIYNKVLRLRLEQNRYSSLNRTLELLDLIVRDPECSRLVVGWSISKMSWTEAFSHIETFIDLIDIKTENSLDMANGLIPRLKIKVIEILDRITRTNLEQTEKIIHQTQLIIRMIHSIRGLVDLASKIHNQRVVGSIWQGKGSTNNFEKAASAMIVPKLELKVEPSNGGGSRDMDIFNAPSQGFSHRQGTLAMQQRTGSSSSLVLHNMPQGARLALSPSPSPPPQPPSSSPIAPPTSLFSSFHENLSENVHYKPISLGLGCNDGEGVGSRRMMSFMSPDNRIFDFMVLLKLELEFVLNVIHTVPEYRTYLFNREPTEYRALAFAVSKIVVWEMGFPVQAQELALEVLGILVIHDEEEPYYLDLVRNMNSIVREEL